VVFDALLYKTHRDVYRRPFRSVPPWHYYAAVLALRGACVALALGLHAAAGACAAAWAGITAAFCWGRLRGTAHSPSHVAEMIVT
ncbi:glycosyltransferase family 2 protein, partial [Burkholderia pseudomallei]